MPRTYLCFTLLTGFLILAGCTPTSPPHPMASSLALHFEVLDNHQDGLNSFKAALTLTNTGTTPLPEAGWTLYFNFGRIIAPESLPPTVRITHINGDFFKLEPTEAFAPLPPGASLTVSFDAAAWVIKTGEAPNGFYLVATDDAGNALPPEPVTEATVAPFTRRQQTDRMAGDNLAVPTPASRYAQNPTLDASALDPASRIVPTPVTLQAGTGTLTLDGTVAVYHDAGLEAEAAYLADALVPLLGTRLPTTDNAAAAAKTIRLTTGAVTVGGAARQPGAEAYRLTIDAERGIEIVGTDGAGVLYGIQTLRAWLPVEAYRQTQPSLAVEAVTVADAPRFGYRGLHLDVGRNFQPKDAVMKLLDLMAFYKLNRFHFHLTDDEGWRLAIDGLPELTDIGSRRGHTLDERDRLVPSFGSGPSLENPHGSGHYTRADFIDILRHAHARHIEVIPEIDMPGHARAALVAMKARHARLTEAGRAEEAEAFLLHDPEDRSAYQSVQMWTDNVVNVCQPSTYHFLETVVDDLAAMYAEAGAPLTTVHIGGDEVPHGVWTASPACERLIADEADLNGPDDLWPYFLRRFSGLLAARGLITAGWEEITLTEEEGNGQTVKVPNEAFVNQGFRAYVWNNVWGWGAEDVVYKLANAGYPVVMANATNLYFDLAYDKDPLEPGYYWAAFVDTRKPFEFVPLDLYKSAWADRMGNAIDPQTAFRDHARLTDAGRANILGLQGQVWGENAKGLAMMEYLAFPKLLGLAERAWAAPPAWAATEDPDARARQLDAAWSRFAHTLGRRDLPRLDYLYGGVAYRLPPPGAVVEDGMLKANVAFPGLAIRYTTDGTEPTAASPLYTAPVPATRLIRLKTFDTRGRSSRTTQIGQEDG